jgi:tetratricopeptide (TPR) repeat protein
MNTTAIIRLCIIALVIIVVTLIGGSIKDPVALLIFIISVGAVGGLLAVKYFIPWLGDLMGTFIYSSGEEVQQDERMKASAKLAQGDYEGAIAEFEKLLKANPQDTFAIAEAAKVYADRMDEPDRALTFIDRYLRGREWGEDDAAFLMFRMIEIHLEKKKDYDKAREALNEVIAKFPNTRHSANAHHKISEVEQAQYKDIIAARQKQSGQGA